MRLVVDTNRIIAALIRDSLTRRLILFSKINFITAGFSKKEVEKYKVEILEKAKINEGEFYKTLSILLEKIEVIDDIAIERKMPDARKIMDNIDKDDTIFIALALAIDNDGIWSDDKHFARQKIIPVFTTEYLSRLFNI